MDEVCEAFLEAAPGWLAELASAWSAGNRNTAARMAHTLKSSASTFGGPVVADPFHQLENRLREAQVPAAEVQPLVTAAQSRARELLMDVRQHRSRRPRPDRVGV